MKTTKHDNYLNKIYNNVNVIGVDRYYVDFILKEPKWYNKYDLNEKSLCDIIICTTNGFAIPVELKQTTDVTDKAISQIKQGIYFIEYELQRQVKEVIFANYFYNKINYIKMQRGKK